MKPWGTENWHELQIERVLGACPTTLRLCAGARVVVGTLGRGQEREWSRVC